MLEIDPLLSRLAYRCFPNGCPRDRTCCIGLAVAVSRHEMLVIDSLMDELSRVAPWLRQEDGFVDAFAVEPEEIEIEPRDEKGTCPFLFAHRGRALCAIHHTALQTGRDVAAVKPRACRHWPLVLESRGRRLHITVHPSAQSMGCVAPLGELPGQPTVREVFGREIQELRAALATPGDRGR